MSKEKLPRLTISAPHRSSGKSTVTIGLCAALTKRGHDVRPFKKGPDFIDPMWHESATGNLSHNLDQYMFGDDKVVESFRRFATGGDVSLIEGNMGLYDGMDMEGTDSTAGLSRLIKSPVVLVIDCYGMTRGIAPLVKGFETFEPETRILGVILNKVKGARHENRLKAAIERYCDAEVLGALPQESGATIEMRHLGLIPLREDTGLEPRIEAMRALMEKYVDIGRVIDIADSAEAVEPLNEPKPAYPEPDIKIGVAMDPAFTFYYPENLDALRMAGAELVPFSPMNDDALPDVDALYIGGGFPEVHMKALENNAPMREAMRLKIEAGLPVYAECGGLMYLCGSISYMGKKAAMVGAIPGDVVMSKRPAGHGYVRLSPTGKGRWPSFGEEVVAHEFHHSSIEGLAGVEFAYGMMRGKGIDGLHDGAMVFNVLAGYAHLHACSTPGWGVAFAGFVRRAARGGS